MKQQFKNVLLRANAAAVVRGLRFGPGEFLRCCERNLCASYSMENRLAVIFPQVEFREIVDSRHFPIRLPGCNDADEALPVDQALILASILLLEQPREILEIGTFMGHISRLMVENPEHAIVHTVDLPLDFHVDEAANTDISGDRRGSRNAVVYLLSGP